MSTAIKLRGDSTANWTINKSVVLLDREVALDTTLNRYKVGDGKTTWENLPFIDESLENNTNRQVYFSDKTMNSFFKELYIDLSGYALQTAFVSLYCVVIIKTEGIHAFAFKLNNIEGTEVLGFYKFEPYDEATEIITLVGPNNSGLKGYAVVNWDAINTGTVQPNEIVKPLAYNIKFSPRINQIAIEANVLQNTNDIYLIINNKTDIVCDGDSLTMGTEDGEYPTILQTLIGVDRTVHNRGVGGETVDTIIARQGAFPIYSQVDFVLKSDSTQKTCIADGHGGILGSQKYLKSTYDDNEVTPLLQMGSERVNPIYINGIACTLTKEVVQGGNGMLATDCAWYINRVSNGTFDTTIKTGTSFICADAKTLRKKVRILWCGTNGGYSSNADLINKFNRYTNFNANDNIIYIGLHVFSDLQTAITQESEMTKAFGSRYFNLRRYFTLYALKDFGITPTAKDASECSNLGWSTSDVVYLTANQIANNVPSDIYQMSLGKHPSSFFRRAYRAANDPLNDTGVLETEIDQIHLNYAGYNVVANKVYELIQILNF